MVCLTLDPADFPPSYPTPVPLVCLHPFQNNCQKNADSECGVWKTCKSTLTRAEGKGCLVARESWMSTCCILGGVLGVRSSLYPQTAAPLVRPWDSGTNFRRCGLTQGLGGLALGQANVDLVLHYFKQLTSLLGASVFSSVKWHY